jgi:hypothetical protein
VSGTGRRVRRCSRGECTIHDNCEYDDIDLDNSDRRVVPAAVYNDPKRDEELDGIVILECDSRGLITRPRCTVCEWRGELEHRMRVCEGSLRTQLTAYNSLHLIIGSIRKFAGNWSGKWRLKSAAISRRFAWSEPVSTEGTEVRGVLL